MNDKPSGAEIDLEVPTMSVIAIGRKILIIFVFIVLAVPGVLCTLAFIYTGYLGLNFPSRITTLVSHLALFETSLSGDIVSLVLAVFPTLVLVTCFKSATPATLTATGVLCLLLSSVGTLANFAGFFLLNIEFYATNVASKEVIAALRSLCEKAGYVTLLYTVMLLRMRPVT